MNRIARIQMPQQTSMLIPATSRKSKMLAVDLAVSVIAMMTAFLGFVCPAKLVISAR